MVGKPEPPEGPLVPGAEPDPGGHPLQERESTDIVEIVCRKIFGERIGTDCVTHHPNFHDEYISRLEDPELYAGFRLSGFSCPWKHVCSANFFCIADNEGRL